MLVAVTHAGHALQSSKSSVSELRFVPTIMLSIYTHVDYLFNIIIYCRFIHVNHCNCEYTVHFERWVCELCVSFNCSSISQFSPKS